MRISSMNETTKALNTIARARTQTVKAWAAVYALSRNSAINIGSLSPLLAALESVQSEINQVVENNR